MTRLLAISSLAACLTLGPGVVRVVGQSPSERAVRMSAQVQTAPATIRLSWPADSRSVNYYLYRKLRDSREWSGFMELGPNITSYLDTNVVAGGAYEYWVSKWTETGFFGGEGYIFAGIQAAKPETRGKMILLVEATHATALAFELERFQRDLAGDGWVVRRHDVPRMAVDPANNAANLGTARSNELAAVKALIKAEYDADPSGVRTVLLFGHIPVPYSGDINPDAHAEHKGAWPADGYYGDMDGIWTDSTVNRSSASDPRNRNVPGDGKFDQNIWPSSPSGQRALELQVGRVDMANLPAFAQGETELLRQYLNKNHRFRHGQLAAGRRGLIDDNLGYFAGEAPAVNGWRDFAAFFGATNTVEGDWVTTPSPGGYLWGFGCGGGTYTTCSGVITTPGLTSVDPPIVFSMLFGSYFGDWDSGNNLLRSCLATTNYTLTSAWVTRPYWHFHHMGLGETIGFSTLASQNTDGSLYSANGLERFVHVALMGDPTLRMHVVAPAADLRAETNGAGGVSLSWASSPDSVVGYHVYRAPNLNGPFIRLNPDLLTETNYVDALAARCSYMVRALKLEMTGSGSYYNLSQGTFTDFSPPSALPLLVVRGNELTKVYGAPIPSLTVSYDGFVNGDTTNSLDSPATASTTATASSPVGTYPIQVSGASSTNYVISFVNGTLTVTPAGTQVSVTPSVNPSLPGEPVTFSAMVQVVPPGAGSPTGTVQFRIDGTNAGGALPLINAQASLSVSNLAAGYYTVEAVYSGETNFQAATASLSAEQLVNTPPEARPDIVERDATNDVVVSVAMLLDNDLEADAGDSFFLVAVSPTSAQGGAVTTDFDSVMYSPPPNVTNVDTFTYEITDMCSATATGLVTVISAGYRGLPTELSISNHQGSVVIRGTAIPGQVVRLQAVHQLELTNWSVVGSSTSSPSGVFQFIDTMSTTQRWYRSIYP